MKKTVIGIIVVLVVGFLVAEEYAKHLDYKKKLECDAIEHGIDLDEFLILQGKPSFEGESYDGKSIVLGYKRNSFFASGPFSFTFNKRSNALVSRICQDIW